ncbi:MAG TPA: D-aminoacyl-tRNA deacylase [Tepidisphaeraceae bacterium]|nr:D-aminoacyl-tRNA deacylase [Tepidisphaeraceae bacterium]
MLCVIQRVTEASVTVAGEVVGKIGRGMVVLAAVERGDTSEQVEWIASKLVGLRIFQNEDKHFDCDLKHIGGAMLVVSNFTVAAATRKGRRPSFDSAADPVDAASLFDQLVRAVEALDVRVQTGKFGADMKVSLVNDGPATFIVRSDSEDLS